MGHPSKLSVKGFADVILNFVDFPSGELFAYLDMEVDMNVVLHAVGADGVGSADAWNGFGDGANRFGIQASGVGDHFDAFEKDFVDRATEEQNDADGEEWIEPREAEGAASHGSDGEDRGVDIGSGVSGIGQKERAPAAHL